YEELGLASIIGVEESAYSLLFNHNFGTVNYALKDSNHALVAVTNIKDATSDFSSIESACNNAQSLLTAILSTNAADIKYILSNDKKKVTFEIWKNDELIAQAPAWFAVLNNEVATENHSQT